MTTPDPAAVETVMRVLECRREFDELTLSLYCAEHNFGWLRDTNCCPRAERVVAALDLDARDRAPAPPARPAPLPNPTYREQPPDRSWVTTELIRYPDSAWSRLWARWRRRA